MTAVKGMSFPDSDLGRLTDNLAVSKAATAG